MHEEARLFNGPWETIQDKLVTVQSVWLRQAIEHEGCDVGVIEQFPGFHDRCDLLSERCSSIEARDKERARGGEKEGMNRKNKTEGSTDGLE